MPVGLQLLDDQERAIVDTTVRVGRFTSSFVTDGSSGSFTDSRLVGVDLKFFYFVTTFGNEYGGPIVDCNHSTGEVTWSYEITSQNQDEPNIPSQQVFYGAF